MADSIAKHERGMTAHIMPHIGKKKYTEKPARSIISLAIKQEKNFLFSISGTIAQNYSNRRRSKSERNRNGPQKKLHFLNHSNIVTVRHLNISKFHLSKTKFYLIYLSLLKLYLI